ncbi:hypothetical protein L195_g061071, partial [Trifolium pratense]
LETLKCAPVKVSGLNPPGVTSCVEPFHTEQSSGFKMAPRWWTGLANECPGYPRGMLKEYPRAL